MRSPDAIAEAQFLATCLARMDTLPGLGKHPLTRLPHVTTLNVHDENRPETSCREHTEKGNKKQLGIGVNGKWQRCAKLVPAQNDSGALPLGAHVADALQQVGPLPVVGGGVVHQHDHLQAGIRPQREFGKENALVCVWAGA